MLAAWGSFDIWGSSHGVSSWRMGANKKMAGSMKILRRYIGKQVLLATLVTLGVVACIQVLMQMITQLSSIGRGHFGFLTAVYCAVLQLPYAVYELFPVIGFLGSIAGLGRLASSNELVVMLSSGVSKFQVFLSVLLVSMSVMLVVSVAGEVFGPALLVQSNTLEHNAIEGKHSVFQRSIWFRQGREFVNIEKVVSDNKIENIFEFLFLPNNKLSTVTYAKRGSIVQDHWHLQQGHEWHIYSKYIKETSFKDRVSNLEFNPQEQLKVDNTKMNDVLPLPDLLKTIHYLKTIGFDSSQLEYAFWHRVFQPVAAIMMICLGVPFVFGNLREVPLAQRLMWGFLVGFVFYMVNSFVGELSLMLYFSPVIAAAIPSVLFLVLCVFFINKKQ